MKKAYPILTAAANKLAKSYFRKFFYSFLVPVDYTRTKEIPAMLDLSGILTRRTERLKILDIGSPQILSLSLGLYSDLWDITYVNSFRQEIDDMRQKSSILGLNRLHITEADITRLDTLSHLGEFDYIFSCSVFEHIHPESGGDIIASKNVPQLLKMTGFFVFSVPYYREKFNEYREGNVYAIRGDSNRKTFFQRFYDEESLHSQIVEPTGLKTANRKYIGERFYFQNDIKKRVALLIGFGKCALILGRFFNKISDIFMEMSSDYKKLKKPYLAIYSLVKNETAVEKNRADKESKATTSAGMQSIY
jgi:hypothetical protein